MECTDLMLDDWVLDTYTGKPMRVQCVNIKVGKGLDPIPITPDILEKNGFTDGEYKNYCGFVWKYKADGFRKIGFTIQEKQGIIWGEKIKKEYPNAIGDEFSIPGIRYLHELQHALRLCGIDKEIVL